MEDRHQNGEKSFWGLWFRRGTKMIREQNGYGKAYLSQSMTLLADADPQLARAMEQEAERQENNIELIASENYVSPAVMAAMGSCLTNKYAKR